MARGTQYSAGRAVLESALRVAYAGGWPAALYGVLPRARRVHVARFTLPILPPGAAPLRLGFASDLHVGPTTGRATLDAAFAHLAAAKPDVLLLGGDFVYLEMTPAKAARVVDLVARVGAPTTLAVLGNHDLWTEHDVLERALERAGVTVLVNAAATIAPHVHVVGLDDPWTGVTAPDRAFAGVPSSADDVRIVLCHAPDALPHVAGRGVSLYVCGHTHGGHLAAPWGPLYVPGRWGRRHPAGLYDVDGVRLFVSRGVGATEVPVRTFAPPDVAVFDLTARPPRAT